MCFNSVLSGYCIFAFVIGKHWGPYLLLVYWGRFFFFLFFAKLEPVSSESYNYSICFVELLCSYHVQILCEFWESRHWSSDFYNKHSSLLKLLHGHKECFKFFNTYTCLKILSFLE